MSTRFPAKKCSPGEFTWVTSGAEFSTRSAPEAHVGSREACDQRLRRGHIASQDFFRAPDAQPMSEKPPPPKPARSQLLPRCARQVELFRMGQQRRTHAVNKVGTLLFPAATGAAGSVDGLHTRATRGAAPPPSTSSRSGRRLQPCTVCAPHGPFASCGTGSSPEGRGSSRATTEAQWSLHVPIFSDFCMSCFVAS